jgi:hypothetical protein
VHMRGLLLAKKRQETSTNSNRQDSVIARKARQEGLRASCARGILAVHHSAD